MMALDNPDQDAQVWSATVAEEDAEPFVLRLYVTGITPRSANAIEAVHRVCREHLAGHVDLEIVDLYEHPELAKEAQVIAAPTLVKSLPLPLRRIVGDLSDFDRLTAALGLDPDV